MNDQYFLRKCDSGAIAQVKELRSHKVSKLFEKTLHNELVTHDIDCLKVAKKADIYRHSH